MNSAKRDPRDMTDEERLNWARELKSKQTGWQGCAGARGFCALYAIKNPFRKKILQALKEKPLARGEISRLTDIEGPLLILQMAILEESHLIETDGDTADLTPSGITFVRTGNL